MTAVDGSRSSEPRRPSLREAAHLAVLWAFAVAQPMFDLLSRNPEFFVARQNTRGDILVLAIGLVALPPLIMLALEAAIARIRLTLSQGLHLALVAALTAVIALQALKALASRPGGVLIALALVAGVAAAYAYRGTRFVPSVLTLLSPAPVLFVVLFLLFSPVSDLVLPHSNPAPASVRVGAPAPVVMVVFDELPASSLMDADGRIDPTLYPSFADLARRSTWYRNATTLAHSSPRAVPAILTGSDPGTRLPVAFQQPHSIFTLLGRSYRMNVTETLTQICPADLCPRGRPAESRGARLSSLISDLSVLSEHLILPDGLRSHLPRVDQSFGRFRTGGRDRPEAGQAQLGQALRRQTEDEEGRGATFDGFLGSLTDRDRTLSLIHFNIPHRPWQYLPSGQQYEILGPDINRIAGRDVSGGRARGSTVWGDDAWAVGHAYQRHLLQVGFADRLVGKLIGRLKALGIWGRAVVVVTADHGISFRPGSPARLATGANIGAIASVPLLIKAPDQRRGRVVDRQVETIDIVPTVAEVLEAPLPWAVGGRSALGGNGRGQVTVFNAPGDQVRVPFAAFVRRLDRLVAEKVALFDTGGRSVSPFAFGPRSELLGEPVRRLRIGGAKPIEVHLAERFAGVSPRAAVIPALVEGTISGPLRIGAPLAVAVNGRVAATTRSFKLDGTARLLAVIPPSVLRRGSNQLEVLRLNGRRG